MGTPWLVPVPPAPCLPGTILSTPSGLGEQQGTAGEGPRKRTSRGAPGEMLQRQGLC